MRGMFLNAGLLRVRAHGTRGLTIIPRIPRSFHEVAIFTPYRLRGQCTFIPRTYPAFRDHTPHLGGETGAHCPDSFGFGPMIFHFATPLRSVLVVTSARPLTYRPR